MNKVLVKAIGLIVLIIALAVTLVIMNSGRKKVKCSSVKVLFTRNYHFVSENQIANIIYNRAPRVKRSLLDTINTDRLEFFVQKHPWVKKAEIFKSYGLNDSLKRVGTLNVRIIQEEPFLRVMNDNGGYYMTEDGVRMPFSSHYTPKVIVVTGNTSDEFMKTEVIEFVRYINKSTFWKSQIQQIHVRADKELVLVPRVGSHLILLGSIENLDIKFRNLMAVYKEGFTKYGTWNKYKYVNLKFENQVVCTIK
jgi:cell division protein FtsQ